MPNKVQIQLIKECLDNSHKMTMWEWEFINSIADKFDDYELTEKQNSVLNQINQKVHS